MFLEELEKMPDTQIIIRPRRFGKSLFISMMRAYYDKSKTDKFDSLFSVSELFFDLWINRLYGEKPLKQVFADI